MIKIIFEPHGTTTDNEKHLASGLYDVELSELGVQQAKELGERHKDEEFDAIFCSDLQRSYKTAEIAFGNKYPIIRDKRLNECDYGDLTQHPSGEVDAEKIKRVNEPFPNGESYKQASERMRNFLEDLLKEYDEKRIMIIGHRATQYGLERWINGVTIEDSVRNHENWKWQPGWTYELKEIKN
ncbi:MAG: histidine phosphatase family protein [Patescibacteria group bacterium]|nr:histidine phosphatase family protein [Patescibacteria group bacterium]